MTFEPSVNISSRAVSCFKCINKTHRYSNSPYLCTDTPGLLKPKRTKLLAFIEQNQATNEPRYNKTPLRPQLVILHSLYPVLQLAVELVLKVHT